VAAVQIPARAVWTLSERMNAEKEAFGFYFSAHPVDRYAHVAAAHGARNFSAICNQPAPVDGSRTTAVMAALVENVRWRTSAKGKRYLMATLSDPSGAFEVTCFDEGTQKDIEDAARHGGCGLLNVELDRRPGEETPRVTVRRIQALESLAGHARLKAEIVVNDPAAIARLADALSGARGGRSDIIVRAVIGGGREAVMLLGRDFLIDGELADAISTLAGVGGVSLTNAEAPRLALVS
jgi:DNA polymerase III subunit alpha